MRFALLETLGARPASRSCRGRGWGGVFQNHHARACGGTLPCVLPQHVQCESARSATGIGAPSPQARLIPRAFSACAAALRAAAVRTGRRCAPAPFSCDPIMPVRAGSPLGEGVSRIMVPRAGSPLGEGVSRILAKLLRDGDVYYTPLDHKVGHFALQAQQRPRACSRAPGSPRI